MKNEHKVFLTFFERIFGIPKSPSVKPSCALNCMLTFWFMCLEQSFIVTGKQCDQINLLLLITRSGGICIKSVEKLTESISESGHFTGKSGLTA